MNSKTDVAVVFVAVMIIAMAAFGGTFATIEYIQEQFPTTTGPGR